MQFDKIDFKKYLKWVLFGQVLLAFSAVFIFVFFTGPLVIGAGKFSEIINFIETTDYRFWIVIAACLYFLMALTIFLAGAFFTAVFLAGAFFAAAFFTVFLIFFIRLHSTKLMLRSAEEHGARRGDHGARGLYPVPVVPGQGEGPG